jgi:ribosomal protein S16
MKGYENKNLILVLHKAKHKSYYNIIVRRKRTDGNSNLDAIGRLTFNKIKNTSYLYINTTKFKHYLTTGIKMSMQLAKLFGIDYNIIKYVSKKKKNEK